MKHCNDNNKPWECDKCTSKSLFHLPFANLDDSSWLMFNEIKLDKKLSDDINIINSIKVKDFISQCESIKESIYSDEDEFHSTQVNSKYYDIDQLKLLPDLPSSFGLFHINIASLNKHIDNLKFILSRLNFNVDIIGISEHKILKETLHLLMILKF